MKHFILGNWKSFGSFAAVTGFSQAFEATSIKIPAWLQYGLALPYHLIGLGRSSAIGLVGAENVSAHSEGAYTGEIHHKMIREMECDFCLVGHSERRQFFGETDEIVGQKLNRLVETGTYPIVCIGETLEEREQGKLEIVLSRQLQILNDLDAGTGLAVAYEPVWAIGTGKAATPQDVAGAHGFIRSLLDSSPAPDAPILYGGSVKPGNAADLANIDQVQGFLIGGASLDAKSFRQIIEQYAAQKQNPFESEKSH